MPVNQNAISKLKINWQGRTIKTGLSRLNAEIVFLGVSIFNILLSDNLPLEVFTFALR